MFMALLLSPLLKCFMEEKMDVVDEMFVVLGGRVNVTIHKDEGEAIQSVELSPSLGNYMVKRKMYGLIYEESYF